MVFSAHEKFSNSMIHRDWTPRLLKTQRCKHHPSQPYSPRILVALQRSVKYCMFAPNRWLVYVPTNGCTLSSISIPTNKSHTNGWAHWIPPTFACTPLHIFPVWKAKPWDLRAITPDLLYKENFYLQGILVSSTPLYKHRAPSSIRYVKIPSSHTTKFLEILLSLT